MEKNPNATADEINAERERQRGIIDPILSKAKKRADLEDYVNDMRKRSQDDSLGEMFSDKEKRIIDDETEKLLEWLADNPNATEEEIEKKRLEIKKN